MANPITNMTMFGVVSETWKRRAFSLLHQHLDVMSQAQAGSFSSCQHQTRGLEVTFELTHNPSTGEEDCGPDSNREPVALAKYFEAMRASISSVSAMHAIAT
jgi:hypothetical protein